LYAAAAVDKAPDYRGIDLAVTAMGGNGDIEVAAGLAVQGEYSGALDDAAGNIMSIVQGPGHSGYGIAQASSNEITALGLKGDPHDPSIAVKVMQARIENAQGLCQNCTAKDMLIVAALDQNGGGQISPQDIKDLSNGANGGGIDWKSYFKAPPTSAGQIDAQVRVPLSGLKNYKSLLLLKYVQDLREIVNRGWDLPDGVTEADLNDMEDIANGE
jgi:hypothetical protein